MSGRSCALAVLALGAAWAVRRAPRFVLAAPLGDGVAKPGSAGLQAATAAFGDSGAPGKFFARPLVGGVAGRGVRAAINAGLAWGDPKGAGGAQ